MRNPLLLCLVAAGFLTASCTAELRIKTEAMEPRPVIYALLNDEPGHQYVYISCTAPYFGEELPQNIDARKVYLNGAELAHITTGIYSTEATFRCVPGETYRLEVVMDFDKDGKEEHYTATAVCPKKHIVDKVALSMIIKKKTFGPPWFLVVGFQDTPGQDYYGGKLYINDMCYSNRLLRYYVHDLNDYENEGQYIQFPVLDWFIGASLPWDNGTEFELFVGDKLTVELNTLSEALYEYMSEAKEEVRQQIPLFSGQRGNVQGNISGGAYGVFGCYTLSRASVLIPPCENFPTRK